MKRVKDWALWLLAVLCEVACGPRPDINARSYDRESNVVYIGRVQLLADDTTRGIACYTWGGNGSISCAKYK